MGFGDTFKRVVEVVLPPTGEIRELLQKLSRDLGTSPVTKHEEIIRERVKDLTWAQLDELQRQILQPTEQEKKDAAIPGEFWIDHRPECEILRKVTSERIAALKKNFEAHPYNLPGWSKETYKQIGFFGAIGVGALAVWHILKKVFGKVKKKASGFFSFMKGTLFAGATAALAFLGFKGYQAFGEAQKRIEKVEEGIGAVQGDVADVRRRAEEIRRRIEEIEKLNVPPDPLFETGVGLFFVHEEVLKTMGRDAPQPGMVLSLLERRDVQELKVSDLFNIAGMPRNVVEMDRNPVLQKFKGKPQAQHALLFIAGVVYDQIATKKVLEGREVFDESGTKVDDPMKLTLRMLLHETGQWVRTVSRVKIAMVRKDTGKPTDVRDGLQEAFDPKKTLKVEAQSPVVLRSLSMLDSRLTGDRAKGFMVLVRKHAHEQLSMYDPTRWIDEDPSLTDGDRPIFGGAILALREEMTDKESYLRLYVGGIHLQSKELLSSALQKLSLADAFEIHTYLAESYAGGSFSPSPLSAQPLGRAQMVLKLTELVAREDHNVAKIMYDQFRPDRP